MNKLVVVATNFGQKNKNKKINFIFPDLEKLNAIDTLCSQFTFPRPFCWAFQFGFFDFS